MPTLIVKSGPSAGQRLEIESERELGREGAGADLTLADPAVSGRHLRLRPVADGIEIDDLGSTNGTFVNGERITAPVVVRSGDVVNVGGTELELEAPARTGGTVVRPVPAGTAVMAAPPNEVPAKEREQGDDAADDPTFGGAAAGTPSLEEEAAPETGAGSAAAGAGAVGAGVHAGAGDAQLASSDERAPDEGAGEASPEGERAGTMIAPIADAAQPPAEETAPEGGAPTVTSAHDAPDGATVVSPAPAPAPDDATRVSPAGGYAAAGAAGMGAGASPAGGYPSAPPASGTPPGGYPRGPQPPAGYPPSYGQPYGQQYGGQHGGPPPKKNKTVLIVAIVLGLAALAVGGFFAYKAFFDKGLDVEEVEADVSAQLADEFGEDLFEVTEVDCPDDEVEKDANFDCDVQLSSSGEFDLGDIDTTVAVTTDDEGNVTVGELGEIDLVGPDAGVPPTAPLTATP